MTTRTVRFLDPSRIVLATARVTDEGDYFFGAIDLRLTPPELRALFDEFEEIVNGQMFVFLDDIQDKIGAAPVTAAFDDGSEASVTDLQVYPTASEVSFRLVRTTCEAARPATPGDR